MDNVTHTLIGVALGRALWPKEDQRPRRAITWSATVASNLPDIDFLLPQAIHDGKLGYLLHHRGETHTFFWALPLGLATSVLVGLVAKADRGGWGRLCAAGALGALLHVVADFWNSYGVHPFAPFSNRWYYGDFVFILEPLLWMALLPLAWESAGSRVGRLLWGLLGAALLTAAWRTAFLPPSIAAFVTLFGIAMALAQRRWGGLVPGTSAVIGVLCVFLGASLLTRGRVREYFLQAAPGEQDLQLALTPAPANPFCWQMVSSRSTESGRYLGRVGAYSLAPSAYPPSLCISGFGTERTAPMAPVGLRGDPHLVWLGQFESTLSELLALRRAECGFAAFLRFSRNPFWIVSSERLIAGDLRFDREKGQGFSEVQWRRPSGCPSGAVPWEPAIREDWKEKEAKP